MTSRETSRRAESAPESCGGTAHYMSFHEAHHRGQVIMLAHQFGHRLPDKAAYGIWHREKLWKQHGFPSRPR